MVLSLFDGHIRVALGMLAIHLGYQQQRRQPWDDSIQVVIVSGVHIHQVTDGQVGVHGFHLTVVPLLLVLVQVHQHGQVIALYG